jgi:hypothetical protein
MAPLIVRSGILLVVLTHLEVVALMCADGTNAAMAHAVARGGNPAAVGPALAFACANTTTGTMIFVRNAV